MMTRSSGSSGGCRRRASTAGSAAAAVSARVFSLNHGANDAQKTMGIIAGVLFAAATSDVLHSVLGGPAAHAAIGSARCRRLAHHPHDGLEDHQAAAGRRLTRRGTGAGAVAALLPTYHWRARVSNHARHHGAIVGFIAGRDAGDCRRCAGVWRGQIVGAWVADHPDGVRDCCTHLRALCGWRARARTVVPPPVAGLQSSVHRHQSRVLSHSPQSQSSVTVLSRQSSVVSRQSSVVAETT
jgi:hypothetical protein